MQASFPHIPFLLVGFLGRPRYDGATLGQWLVAVGLAVGVLGLLVKLVLGWLGFPVWTR